MRSGKTSPKVAKAASAILKDGRSSAVSRSVAGGALSQSRSSKQTSVQEARTAAKVLANPRAAKSSKSIAASVLSQKKAPFPVKTYRVAGSSLTQKASAAVVRKVIGKSK